MFHLVVEKLLFIIKRSIPDLETDVGFLTTRLLKSDVDDCEKLRMILRFVYFTPKEKRYFRVTILDKIFTWVDA